MYSHVCWKSGFESTRRDIKVHWRGLLNLPTVCQFLDVSCARTNNELVSQVPESNRLCGWHPSCSGIRGMTQFAALVLVLVLGLTTPAVALTTYYVDSAGSNTAPYDTWAKAANALATIAAIDVAGDTIYCASTGSETSAGVSAEGLSSGRRIS